MRKIALALTVLLLAVVLLTGCGNKAVFDTKLTFNEASVLDKGEWRDIKVASWQDYTDGVVQVVSVEGEVFLTHYSNVVLKAK